MVALRVDTPFGSPANRSFLHVSEMCVVCGGIPSFRTFHLLVIPDPVSTPNRQGEQYILNLHHRMDSTRLDSGRGSNTRPVYKYGRRNAPYSMSRFKRK